MMTILLLADDPSGAPADPEKLSLFQLAVATDNVLLVNDPAAFGIPEPATLYPMLLCFLALGAWRFRDCTYAA
jgi:hypothetical protein